MCVCLVVVITNPLPLKGTLQHRRALDGFGRSMDRPNFIGCQRRVAQPDSTLMRTDCELS